MKEQVDLSQYSKFLVVGVDFWGRKFRMIHSNAMHVFMINAYRGGNVWGISKEGKRTLLKKIRT